MLVILNFVKILAVGRLWKWREYRSTVSICYPISMHSDGAKTQRVSVSNQGISDRTTISQNKRQMILRLLSVRTCTIRRVWTDALRQNSSKQRKAKRFPTSQSSAVTGSRHAIVCVYIYTYLHIYIYIIEKKKGKIGNWPWLLILGLTGDVCRFHDLCATIPHIKNELMPTFSLPVEGTFTIIAPFFCHCFPFFIYYFGRICYFETALK